jgi:sirohydrochlorin cobaltochelatase
MKSLNFNLHARLEHLPDSEDSAAALIGGECAAHRTKRSGAGSLELAGHLSRYTGNKVILGFNEFCAPSLEEAIEQALETAPEKIVVITPMMTRGGEHSEVDIPNAIQRAQERHPGIQIIYVWPFDVSQVAQFLASQIAQYN